MTPKRIIRIAAAPAAIAAIAACSVGKGTGDVSGCVYVPGCGISSKTPDFQGCGVSQENYHMGPDFFAADTLEDGSLEIRLQKGGYWTSESDGLTLIIPEYEELSRELDGKEYVDAVVPPWDELESLPPSQRFRVSFFLNKSCGGTGAGFSSGTGALRLYSLYRPDSDHAQIKGAFDLYFEDTRPHEEGTSPAQSRLKGGFDFEYQRGLPAQHFP